ncbi:MAG: hypothetical protein QOG23_302 [Blastocatellia bacterium]|jgi:hypothetical protein|nr:hypothetical protein [Blastocatellia bacterium]
MALLGTTQMDSSTRNCLVHRADFLQSAGLFLEIKFEISD